MSARQIWAAAGVAVVLVTAVVAAPNLGEIYASQKDFVIGSLLSVAGFCFGKAVNRSKEQRDQWLLDSGAFDRLSKLEDAVQAAAGRLAEHYWELESRPVLLRVALDELSKAAINLSELRHIVGSTGRQEWEISPEEQLLLDRIRRDVQEAINRLNSTRDRLADEVAADEGLADVFAVLTADLRNANRYLTAMVGPYTPFPPLTQIEQAKGYLHAAAGRAAEFAELATRKEVGLPETFRIMAKDLGSAQEGLKDIVPAAANAG